MKSHGRAISLVLGSTGFVLLCGTTALADIYTFWKTEECPVFTYPGPNNIPVIKAATSKFVGFMQAPQLIVFDANGNQSGAGVGGPYCVLDTSLLKSAPNGIKQINVGSSDIVVSPTDGRPTSLPQDDPYNPNRGLGVFDTYRCVVCQYPELVILPAPPPGQAIPVLSTWGMVILTLGILTTWIYQSRKGQTKAA